MTRCQKRRKTSGAEIERSVKPVSLYALTCCVDVKDLLKAPDVTKLIVQRDNFQTALGFIEGGGRSGNNNFYGSEVANVCKRK